MVDSSSSDASMDAEAIKLQVEKEVQTFSGWPTEKIRIDYHLHPKSAETRTTVSSNQKSPKTIISPHTLILFIPGNPGCVGWYIPFLRQVLEKLGVGYAVRGVSYAGHGIGEDLVNPVETATERGHNSEKRKCNERGKMRNTMISWTMDGQIEHKIQWFDEIMKELKIETASNNVPKLIFIGHSIGCHFVQKMCVNRPDILSLTTNILHLMPFFRFDPPYLDKLQLTAVASKPQLWEAIVVGNSRLMKSTPKWLLNLYMKYCLGLEDDEGRELALDLYRQPDFARNFILLGMDEIRGLPVRHDYSTMKYLGKECAISLLYAGGPDKWATFTHLEDILNLKKQGMIPQNITGEYFEKLKHAFVIYPSMVPFVVDFCVRNISNMKGTKSSDGLMLSSSRL